MERHYRKWQRPHKFGENLETLVVCYAIVDELLEQSGADCGDDDDGGQVMTVLALVVRGVLRTLRTRRLSPDGFVVPPLAPTQPTNRSHHHQQLPTLRY
ncbi:unnamed protein product [Haemonchus placei]|uniref:Uncharacterized protein n=1 Tax=Haemonchus placei TaxID=6290 RepID=A0A0N4WAR6_HAEPC|nr:unnamed protein product [Haemonchus placei]